MASICIRSIDTRPTQPLLSNPVYCGGFRAAVDCLPWEQDQHQEARSQDSDRPICGPCQKPWVDYLHSLGSRQESLVMKTLAGGKLRLSICRGHGVGACLVEAADSGMIPLEVWPETVHFDARGYTPG